MTTPKKPTAAERKAAEKATIEAAARNLVACAKANGLDEAGVLGAIVSATRSELRPADLATPEGHEVLCTIASIEPSSDTLRDEWQRIEGTPIGKEWARVYRKALDDASWREGEGRVDFDGARKL